MIKRFKEKGPVILNVANTVTQQRVADSISYLGASTIMLSSELEAKDLTELADAVVFNLGTLDQTTIEICSISGKIANQ